MAKKDRKPIASQRLPPTSLRQDSLNLGRVVIGQAYCTYARFPPASESPRVSEFDPLRIIIRGEMIAV